MRVVLASSSVYRKALLQRLLLDFDCYSPDIDESLNHALNLKDNVVAIATKKAQAVAELMTNSLTDEALIIASDQLCSINGQVLGKPHEHSKAVEQLKKVSGQSVIFYTALVVYNKANKQYLQHCDQTTVQFRELSSREIEHYLYREKPYDCAGSFKVESLGVSLFEKVINEDPTALIGLPLIKLCEFLRSNDIEV